MSEFIRVYTLVDIPFQEALKKKLALAVKHRVKEDLPKSVAKMKEYNPNEYDDLNDLPNIIMNSVSVSLPKPNIVVDKTQFEEISNYINNLQTVADKFFNQEMIPSEDSLAQAALPLVKAKWISDQVAKFITEVGSFKMCDIPDLDEIDPSELTSYIQVFQNFGAAVNKHRTAISQPSEDNGAGFGGDSGFGDASGGGNDFGGDMGGDFGSDMGGDLGGSSEGESGPEIGSEPPNVENEGSSSDFDKLNGASMMSKIYYRNSKRAKDKKE